MPDCSHPLPEDHYGILEWGGYYQVSVLWDMPIVSSFQCWPSYCAQPEIEMQITDTTLCCWAAPPTNLPGFSTSFVMDPTCTTPPPFTTYSITGTTVIATVTANATLSSLSQSGSDTSAGTSSTTPSQGSENYESTEYTTSSSLGPSSSNSSIAPESMTLNQASMEYDSTISPSIITTVPVSTAYSNTITTTTTTQNAATRTKTIRTTKIKTVTVQGSASSAASYPIGGPDGSPEAASSAAYCGKHPHATRCTS